MATATTPETPIIMIGLIFFIRIITKPITKRTTANHERVPVVE